MSRLNPACKCQTQRGGARIWTVVALLVVIVLAMFSGTGYLKSRQEALGHSSTTRDMPAKTAAGAVLSDPSRTAEAVEPVKEEPAEPDESAPVSKSPEPSEGEGYAIEPFPSLSISGRVLSDSGVPQTDVRLQARRTHDSIPDEERSAQELSTVSDLHGYYRFSNLEEGEYLLAAFDRNARQVAKSFVQAGAEGADIVIPTVERTLFIQGWIETPSNEPVEGALVFVAGYSQSTAYSDREGFYEIEADLTDMQDRLDLQVRHELYENQEVNIDVGVDVAFDNHVQRDIRLEPLQAFTEIVGMLESTKGEVVAGETVWLYSAEHDRHYSGVSDQYGHFSIINVASAKDYLIQVRPEQPYRDYLAEGVRIGGSVMPLELKLEPKDTGSLSGAMLDPNGFPVPGFGLWLRSKQAAGQQIRLSGDELGYFALDLAPAGELIFESRGTPEIRITGVYLPVGEELEITLIVDRGPHVLEGRVTGSDSRPIPGARLMVTSVYEDNGVTSRSLRKTTTDLDGRFSMVQLGPGPHTIVVEAQHYKPLRMAYEVGADTGALELQLEEIH